MANFSSKTTSEAILSLATLEQSAVRGEIDLNRDYFYGIAFAFIAMALGATAVRGGMGILLSWPALSFGIVSIAYVTNEPRWFGKRLDGSRHPGATASLLPYLIFVSVVWRMQVSVSREAAVNNVNSHLAVSRRLLTHELPDDIDRVCDLTCELVDPVRMRKERSYFCYPVLDAGACKAAELIDLARKLPPSNETKLLIHCANGHGRTGMFAAVWLLVHGFVTSVDDALEMLRGSRPGIRLRRRQRNVVMEAYSALKSCDDLPESAKRAF